MKRHLLFALTMITSSSAHAWSCEENFRSAGDPRNGMAYLAQIKIPGLSIDSALGQLRHAAMEQKFTVGEDNVKGDLGQLYFMQTINNPPVIILGSASSSGDVSVATKLARGQSMPPDIAKANMCAMLSAIKPGEVGKAVANAARMKSGAGQIIQSTAVEISSEVGREADKVARAMNARPMQDILLGKSTSPDAVRDRDAIFMPLAVKYVGRRYQIDGQVYTATRSSFDGSMNIGYLVTKERGLLRIRQDSTSNNSGFTVQCKLAPDQAALFATLGSHDWVKLTGTVDAIDTGGIRLRDCRQAN